MAVDEIKKKKIVKLKCYVLSSVTYLFMILDGTRFARTHRTVLTNKLQIFRATSITKVPWTSPMFTTFVDSKR